MRKLPVTISEAEFLEVMKTLKDKKKRLAFALGFYQCMRVSEVSKLTKDDVDMDRGFLHIKEAKGGKDRMIPIMFPVRPFLKYLPVGVGDRSLQLWCKKFFPKLHFHSFRHSGATFYLNEKKIDLLRIQQLLGHSRLDTTQIYTHVNPEQMRSAYEDIWK